MKKLSVVVLVWLLGVQVINSQIAIRTADERVVQRPITYDSLRCGRMNQFRDAETYRYKQYIGQTLFFVPLTETEKKNWLFDQFMFAEDQLLVSSVTPFEQTSASRSMQKAIGSATSLLRKADLMKQHSQQKQKHAQSLELRTKVYCPIIKGPSNASSYVCNPDSLCGKSFRIVDLFAGTIDKPEPILPNKRPNSRGIVFKLLNDRNDTLYWVTNHTKVLFARGLFVIQGYYDKHKAHYVGETLVYRNTLSNHYKEYLDQKQGNDYQWIAQSNKTTSKGAEGLLDINTSELLRREELEEWKCVDLSLMLSEETSSYELYYILKNSRSNEVKIPIGMMESYGLITKSSYEQETAYVALRNEERLALQRQRQEQIEAANAQRKQRLVNKYGASMGGKIYEGEVVLGMTKEMCIEAWGSTESILKNELFEIWVYSYGSSLTFENGKLVQFVVL